MFDYNQILNETVYNIINIDVSNSDKIASHLLSLDHIVLDNYKEIVKPYFEFMNNVSADVKSTQCLQTFIDSLRHKDYFHKTDLYHYLPFEMDYRDMIFLVFMSFCDYCVDVLHVDSKQLLNDIINNTIDNYDADTKHDLGLYICTMGTNIVDYYDCMTMIVESESCVKSSINNILYHRLRSNYGLAVGLKHTVIPGMTKDEMYKAMIYFFTFFTFFDDVEDYLDDIKNNTPTYISKIYETKPYPEFVQISNLCLYYTFSKFISCVKEYNHGLYMVLDFYKSIYLKIENRYSKNY